MKLGERGTVQSVSLQRKKRRRLVKRKCDKPLYVLRRDKQEDEEALYLLLKGQQLHPLPLKRLHPLYL
jgi:hypothetical protein